MPRFLILLMLTVSVTMLPGCELNEQIRVDGTPCRFNGVDANPDCRRRAALEEHDIVSTRPGTPPRDDSYILSYVEFDDEGKTRDPGQETTLFNRMNVEAAKRDLCIIVFVHGWKHNARHDDENVQEFQALLARVAMSEQKQKPNDRRKVIGIYAGWRGLTWNIPEFAENLTFWNRKDAAERVAQGSIRALLGKVKAFRDQLNIEKPGQLAGKARRSTRMLTIGHSFGGLIVYSALSQYFLDRAATSAIRAGYFPGAPSSDHPNEKRDPDEISGFGDLVVVINPAIEAMRYEPMRELLDQRYRENQNPNRFAPRQTPVFVEVTSEGQHIFDGDWATGFFFPIGRYLNTRSEATTTDPRTHESEEIQITRALGHYKPYFTHLLEKRSVAVPPGEATAPIRDDVDREIECEEFKAFEAEWRDPAGRLREGWHRGYTSGAILTQIKQSGYDPVSPFWIVRADPNVIHDHNDIDPLIFADFVRQLYEDISRQKTPHPCDSGPDRPGQGG